jgi:hypothetical protein
MRGRQNNGGCKNKEQGMKAAERCAHDVSLGKKITTAT